MIVHIMRNIFPIINQKEKVKNIRLSNTQHLIYVFLAKFTPLKITIYLRIICNSDCLKTVLLKFQCHHKYTLREYFVSGNYCRRYFCFRRFEKLN